ncbi:hypothetical protein GFS60_03682 [Rhodococcus sp. WAY2]|nr:hypothetical protein GFS60_03682 [Rhodococcus sp. WAY2]
MAAKPFPRFTGPCEQPFRRPGSFTRGSHNPWTFRPPPVSRTHPFRPRIMAQVRPIPPRRWSLRINGNVLSG